MARPRKLDTEQMLQIVDSYFESNGDPGKLKCSLLEEYAVSQGIDVKAYDFRRNEAVRRHMSELCDSVNLDGIGVIAYKSIDVDSMLDRNNTRETLKTSLIELDSVWRRVYEHAADMSRRNISLVADNLANKQIIASLKTDNEAAKVQVNEFKKSANALMLENRYLRKMINSYLYPAIANEILQNDNVLEDIDTEATRAAINMLTETDTPLPFNKAVAADRQMLSREEALLQRMGEQIILQGGNDVTAET